MSDAAEKMHTGELYDPYDETLFAEQQERMEMLREFNQSSPLEPEKRQELLKQMFAEIGEGCFIEPPLRANWSGKFVHLGNNVYANFNLTLVDDTEIRIGDNTLLGPNVTIAVAGHPLDAKLRSRGWQYNLPVTIGKDCWLGAGVIVMPGVTIGDGTVIGAGSVVTKDIPSGVLAYGVPCRVIRELGVHDREYYFRDRKIPEALKQRFGL